MTSFDDTENETRPLEIHIIASRARNRWVFQVFMVIFYLLTAGYLMFRPFFWSYKILAITPIIWLMISAGFAAYGAYLSSFTKGPAFSFSKYGFIDHRTKTPSIFRWEEIESVAWAARNDDVGKHHILQIKLISPPKIQKLGALFHYHPYRIHSGTIVNKKKRIARRIKSAVPKGKYKTAKNM